MKTIARLGLSMLGGTLVGVVHCALDTWMPGSSGWIRSTPAILIEAAVAGFLGRQFSLLVPTNNGGDAPALTMFKLLSAQHRFPAFLLLVVAIIFLEVVREDKLPSNWVGPGFAIICILSLVIIWISRAPGAGIGVELGQQEADELIPRAVRAYMDNIGQLSSKGASASAIASSTGLRIGLVRKIMKQMRR